MSQTSETTRPAVTLSGVSYAADALSAEAKALIGSIRFCDEALQQRRNELAVADTARIAYSAALKREFRPNGAAADAG